MAVMSSIIYLVALTLLLMRREHSKRFQTKSRDTCWKRRARHRSETTIAVDVETQGPVQDVADLRRLRVLMLPRPIRTHWGR